MNSVVHLGTCIVLGVGPHVAYYHGTPLVDNSTLRSCVHGFVASMLTEIGKLVFLASLISGFDSVEHDFLKTLLHVVVGFLDIPGMWFAVTGITHRNMSTEDKFQSIALGWSMGDTITNRLAPIFLGCLLGDFHWRPLQLALQSNVKLVHALSFAAVACLMWSKRSKPGTLMVLLHLSAAAHSALPFSLGSLKGDSPLMWAVLAAELLVSLLLALSSWGLYRQAGMKHA